MDELKSHIFVKHPDNSRPVCWSCGARMEEHQYVVLHYKAEIPAPKSGKKSNARSVRSKTPGIRAVR
jgi:hypothetical protein